MLEYTVLCHHIMTHNSDAIWYGPELYRRPGHVRRVVWHRDACCSSIVSPWPPSYGDIRSPHTMTFWSFFFAPAPHMLKRIVHSPLIRNSLTGSSRLAQLTLNSKYIPFAERARQAVHKHIDEEGYLRQVCDIHDERKTRPISPEGQCMVLLMEVSARDWQVAKWDATEKETE